jgi:hypothetical protein
VFTTQKPRPLLPAAAPLAPAVAPPAPASAPLAPAAAPLAPAAAPLAPAVAPPAPAVVAPPAPATGGAAEPARGGGCTTVPSHIVTGMLEPMPGMPESEKQPKPSIDASTPHVFMAVQQAVVMMPMNAGGGGQRGATGSGGVHVAPLSEPHTPITGSAQHACLGVIGRPRPGGTIGVMHTFGPQAMPPPLAPADPPATAPPPAAPPLAPPAPTPGFAVPSSPHPNTLTKLASAIAELHARLFIAGNPLRPMHTPTRARVGYSVSQRVISRCTLFAQSWPAEQPHAQPLAISPAITPRLAAQDVLESLKRPRFRITYQRSSSH